MRNLGDDDRNGRARGHGGNGLAIMGMALVLGVAALSAYALSGKDAPVKPATGTAQAMALASSKPVDR